MKKLKSEKGAITLITTITILFIISFLISSYFIISNKIKIQKDMLKQMRKIYEPALSLEEIYYSYFNDGDVIPIYTVDQLLSIGNGNLKSIPQEGGKIYRFAKDANYVLMNNLQFKTSEWSDLIGKDEQGNPKEWTAIGEVIKKDLGGFTGNFEGNGHKIQITDLKGDLHECNEQNEYYYYRTLEIKIQKTTNQDFSVKVNHLIDNTEKTYGKDLLQDTNDGFLLFKGNIDYGDIVEYRVNIGYDTYNTVPELEVVKSGIVMDRDRVAQVELTTQQVFREWAGDEKGVSIPNDGIYELVLVGGGRTEDVQFQ